MKGGAASVLVWIMGSRVVSGGVSPDLVELAVTRLARSSATTLNCLQQALLPTVAILSLERHIAAQCQGTPKSLVSAARVWGASPEALASLELVLLGKCTSGRKCLMWIFYFFIISSIWSPHWQLISQANIVIFILCGLF